MVYLSKIYTKSGDRGTTRLVGGQEIPKDDARIEAYGTVDELLSILGVARLQLLKEAREKAEVLEALDPLFLRLQNELFNLGSELATLPEDQWEGQPLAEKANIDALEAAIDRFNADLKPLKSFVLPGGGLGAGFLHMARTICRRAERRTTALFREKSVSENALIYLNRLSDLLFVLSRWVCLQLGQEELLWQPKASQEKDSPTGS